MTWGATALAILGVAALWLIVVLLAGILDQVRRLAAAHALQALTKDKASRQRYVTTPTFPPFKGGN